MTIRTTAIAHFCLTALSSRCLGCAPRTSATQARRTPRSCEPTRTTITLALNASLSGKSGRPLEGVLPFVDYPVALTLDDRDAWDAAHVAAALRAFKEYPFPKHVAPLGP